MTDTYIVNDCRRCGHLANLHRFDDDQLVTYGRAEVEWNDRPFRCVGPDFEGCAMDCSDFVGHPVTFTDTTETTS